MLQVWHVWGTSPSGLWTLNGAGLTGGVLMASLSLEPANLVQSSTTCTASAQILPRYGAAKVDPVHDLFHADRGLQVGAQNLLCALHLDSATVSTQFRATGSHHARYLQTTLLCEQAATDWHGEGHDSEAEPQEPSWLLRWAYLALELCQGPGIGQDILLVFLPELCSKVLNKQAIEVLSPSISVPRHIQHLHAFKWRARLCTSHSAVSQYQ